MIRLSAKTEYALRAMIDLASHPNERTKFPAIAERQGIPRKFLPTVLQSLAQAGYIRTVRGYGGGVEMVADPAEVTLREIIENVEGPQRLHDCEARGFDSSRISDCLLRDVLERAGDSMLRVLEQSTLSDLVPPECVAGGGRAAAPSP